MKTRKKSKHAFNIEHICTYIQLQIGIHTYPRFYIYNQKTGKIKIDELKNSQRDNDSAARTPTHRQRIRAPTVHAQQQTGSNNIEAHRQTWEQMQKQKHDITIIN